MIFFIIFIIIGFIFWIYTTLIDKNFYNKLQNQLADFANGIVKKISPMSDSLFNNNIPLMKINLFMMTFNKNIDLYNIIYNSSIFNFLINKDNLRNIKLDDFSNLLPFGIELNQDMIQTKANLTMVSDKGFSKFFLNLTNKGMYLLDIWDIFLEFMKPLLIIKSNNDVINRLNTLHLTDTYNSDKLAQINDNILSIIDVIYECILILSNITITYKQIIDINNDFNNPSNNRNINDYNTEKNKINFNATFTNLDDYLNKTDFQYVYVKSYINKVIGTNDTFINSQFNKNYIILYRMFSQIDGFFYYYQLINPTILDNASNPKI